MILAILIQAKWATMGNLKKSNNQVSHAFSRISFPICCKNYFKMGNAEPARLNQIITQRNNGKTLRWFEGM